MWPDRQETADLVTFTEEILNEKLHFLCIVHRNNTQTLATEVYRMNNNLSQSILSDTFTKQSYSKVKVRFIT